jgi:hypothetical protein
VHGFSCSMHAQRSSSGRRLCHSSGLGTHLPLRKVILSFLCWPGCFHILCVLVHLASRSTPYEREGSIAPRVVYPHCGPQAPVPVTFRKCIDCHGGLAVAVVVGAATVSGLAVDALVSPPPHLHGLPSKFASSIVRDGVDYAPHMCAPTLVLLFARSALLRNRWRTRAQASQLRSTIAATR